MLSPSLVSSLVKVLVVGGLMAGGAGGFYLVAANRSSGDNPRQVIAATPSAVTDITPGSETGVAASATSGTPTVSGTLDTPTPPAATPTPPSVLTDTGYKAPDGSPLYAECIAQGLTLPPSYPIPSGVQPTPMPSGSLNAGPPPTADKLPPFDLRTLRAATQSGWSTIHSDCYGYSLSVPPGWVGARKVQVGYQQGETTSIGVRNQVSLLVQYDYSEADLIALEQNAHGGNGVYLFAEPLRKTLNAHEAIEAYAYDDSPLEGGNAAALVLRYVVHSRGPWWVNIVATLYEPYRQEQASELRAALDSVLLP